MDPETPGGGPDACGCVLGGSWSKSAVACTAGSSTSASEAAACADPSAAAPSPACFAADLSGDGQVAVGDVLQVLAKFGLTESCGEPADVNGDCKVSVADVLLVLTVFGQRC